MTLHLLLTPAIAKTMPNKECKMVHDFGQLEVVFEDHRENGKHCIIEAERDTIIKWLKPFDHFVIGKGSPFMEQFEIVHINDITTTAATTTKNDNEAVALPENTKTGFWYKVKIAVFRFMSEFKY